MVADSVEKQERHPMDLQVEGRRWEGRGEGSYSAWASSNCRYLVR
jgi:hypothetical protein